jgi:hypothetical protein
MILHYGPRHRRRFKFKVLDVSEVEFEMPLGHDTGIQGVSLKNRVKIS